MKFVSDIRGTSLIIDSLSSTVSNSTQILSAGIDLLDLFKSKSTVDHIITRGAFQVDADEQTFLTLQENSFAGDSQWSDITYIHTLLLPYDTTVNRIMIRGTATNGATVKVGMHTNNAVTGTGSIDYKFFPVSAVETQTTTFTYNNEPQTLTFTNGASARSGKTIGISISADQHLGMVNASVVFKCETS